MEKKLYSRQGRYRKTQGEVNWGALQGAGVAGFDHQSGVSSTGNPLLDEARKRFQRCEEWEATWRRMFVSDIKFAYGDPDNGYQWPDAIKQARDSGAKPCLTMNIIRQHNLQILNQALRDKEEIKIIGAGGDSTAESAEAMMQLVSHIQYDSVAQTAYKVARDFQVAGGCGYWRLATDWESPESFAQKLLILQKFLVRPHHQNPHYFHSH